MENTQVMYQALIKQNSLFQLFLLFALFFVQTTTSSLQAAINNKHHAAIPENVWFDFAFQWDQLLPSPISMEKHLDAPAGKHGFLTAKGENLVFEDGQAFRLWGVNIAFSMRATDTSVPPPKDKAAKLADKIASMGFNHVRFIGFDGNAPKAMENWLKTGELKSELLDRLDYLIKQLRDRGIYYSFCLLNGSYPLFKDTDKIRPNTRKKKFQAYRTTRLFDNFGRQQLANWVEAFFYHRNPYTRLRYANDPANAYYSTINEDTAFLAYYSNMNHYDAYWQSRINQQFSYFLQKKYQSTNKLGEQWSELGKVGLLPGEDVFKQTVLVKPLSLKLGASRERRHDTAEFLLSIDQSLNNAIDIKLSALGYKGLRSGNTKWYGLGSLYSDYLSGNYIEGHVYFGQNRKKSKNDIAHFGNTSYLDRMVSGKQAFFQLMKDDRFGLSRILPANLIDRPYIISEWNHSIWSDYAYEGPLLLTGYGSAMGVDGMDIQILYNHPHPEYNDAIPRTKHTVMGNPLHTALLPSLSLAFQRKDIPQSINPDVFCMAKDEDEILNKALIRPRNHAQLDKLAYAQGIENVRTAILGGCQKKKTSKASGVRQSAIKVVRSTQNKGQLRILSKRFEALAGDLNNAETQGILSSQLKYNGALVLISLTDQALDNTECALLTIVGPIRNSDTESYYKGTMKYIKKTGKGMPQMRGNTGNLILNYASTSTIRQFYAIYSDGKIRNLGVEPSVNKTSASYVLPVTGLRSPWILIGNPSCTGRYKPLSVLPS